jgi:nicotinamide mononucleotide transporter
VTLPADALRASEILATIAGAGYVVLAARRSRLCWIAGAVSSALFVLVFAAGDMPMQAGLQVFYVAMSAYGWWSWTRSAAEGELPVALWPLPWHIGAAIFVTLISLLTARWLASETHAAWPLLDSLTTWFSLLATWLTARAKLENWLYWIVIDAALVFVFFEQRLWFTASLYLFFIAVAVAGFVGWRRRWQLQAVPA